MHACKDLARPSRVLLLMHAKECHIDVSAGEAVREYINGTVPLMAFGEYWDTCEYTDGVLNYNQDAHRQRTVNWCDKTGGTAAAFDFTTKGKLNCDVFRVTNWKVCSTALGCVA